MQEKCYKMWIFFYFLGNLRVYEGLFLQIRENFCTFASQKIISYKFEIINYKS